MGMRIVPAIIRKQGLAVAQEVSGDAVISFMVPGEECGSFCVGQMSGHITAVRFPFGKFFCAGGQTAPDPCGKKGRTVDEPLEFNGVCIEAGIYFFLRYVDRKRRVESNGIQKIRVYGMLRPERFFKAADDDVFRSDDIVDFSQGGVVIDIQRGPGDSLVYKIGKLHTAPFVFYFLIPEGGQKLILPPQVYDYFEAIAILPGILRQEVEKASGVVVDAEPEPLVR